MYRADTSPRGSSGTCGCTCAAQAESPGGHPREVDRTKQKALPPTPWDPQHVPVCRCWVFLARNRRKRGPWEEAALAGLTGPEGPSGLCSGRHFPGVEGRAWARHRTGLPDSGLSNSYL